MPTNLRAVTVVALCVILLAVSLSSPLATKAQAQSGVSVSINAPALVIQDSIFQATVDISMVQNLDAAVYDVSFDPSVLEFRNVTSGNINGIELPVAGWNQIFPGTIRVAQNVPGIDGVSGSGNLAQLYFHVIGSLSQTSDITLGNGVLSNNLAQEISAQWLEDSVQVTYHEVAKVGIGAPQEMPEGGSFTATVNISAVKDFDAANYDVSFNPSVLELKSVTSGNINGTEIPVADWNLVGGKVSVVQNVPGVQGIIGSGYLAALQFRVIGVDSNVSGITPANGTLSDNQAQIIPSEWSGVTVRVISSVAPVLATNPYSLSHDFGSVPEGETRSWTFEITNIGKGTLEWTVGSNQPWLTPNPASGTTTTETDTITVTVITTGLASGATYGGTITVSSNGGSKTGTATVSVPVLPADLTITALTWSPAESGDGNAVGFTATAKNIGQGKIASDFHVGFDLDGASLGHSLIAGGLAAGASVEINQPWVATPGAHNIKAIVDEYYAVAESDETNNELTKALPAIPFSDLTITSVTWLPASNINDGDTVTLAATAKNIGPGSSARGFFIRFEVDGYYVGHQIVNGLAAGSTADVSQVWIAKSGGHTIKVIADEINMVTEANEGNNELSQILPMVTTLDFTITSLTWLPAGSIGDGDTVTLIATVKNIGQGNTSQEFFVRFEIDGVFIGRVKVSGLAVGSSVGTNQVWIARAGSHTARAIADEYNTIIESNENNNEMSQALPSILVTQYTLSMAVHGNGSVSPPAGDHSYPVGTIVNISATPLAGWQFVNWTGDVANPDSPATTVAMNGNKTVTANFAPHGIVNISDIKTNPDLYDGQKVRIGGVYRGWEPGHGLPPKTRSDWVIQDASGSIYVTGSTMGLVYPGDIGKRLEITGTVKLKSGQPYIQIVR